MVSCSLDFVSIACNRICNCASWYSNGLVAYGAGKFIGIYDCDKQKILYTLRSHKKRVNCVEWISETEIISGSSDTSLILWRKQMDNNRFKPVEKLQIHSNSITSLSILNFPNTDGKTLVVATSSDKSVSVWMRNSQNEEFTLQQHGALAGEAVECCKLHFLPQTDDRIIPLLALGGVGGAGSCRGSEIHLYVPGENENTSNSNTIHFKHMVTLKGHEDWIRCLSFITCDDGSVLLASSAQDNFIRLWKFEVGNEEKIETEKTNDIFTQLAKLDSIHSTSMSHQGHSFQHQGERYSVILESVLYGHEDWVYSVDWHPTIMEDGKEVQPLCLLSASMDKTMMIWRPQEDQDGIWINETRVGELGGNTLGFYGGLFSPNGKRILAHGYNGAFHLWENQANSEENRHQWEPLPTVSGHFGPVNDCSWDPSGDYFITISHDQTARIFSTWKSTNHDDSEIYCEIARPQIHGYDLECGCFVAGRSHCFVTGAEEKIYRVFDAPQSFIHNFESITGKKLEDTTERPLGANVPSLGLSNKPVFSMDENKVKEQPKNDGSELFEPPKPADPVFLQRPPFEEELLQSTLWPEIQKLYGHGNYTFCVTSSHSGDLLATAVRAKSDPEQATIRLWNTSTWKEIANLRAHKLTVTQLRFSHNDKYLLSSGRDRQFSIFKKADSGFELIHTQPKAHDRIIWSCDWSHDDRYFITASRDKTCKVWSFGKETNQCVSLVGKFSPAKVGVNAVSFAPTFENGGENPSYLICVGLENGVVQLWRFDENDTTFSQVLMVTLDDCHSDVVKKISWRSRNEKEGTFQFITCSADHSVRLFSYQLDNK